MTEKIETKTKGTKKSNLLDRLKAIKTKNTKAESLEDNDFFDIEKYGASTGICVLDLALSGKINGGGITPGCHIIAGQSKTFKTILGILAVRGYMEKYPDSVCLFYDTEMGAPAYFKKLGLDESRIITIYPEHVEDMKQSIIKNLSEINEKGHSDRMIIFFDSLGMIASKKELDDAEEEKVVADMSRAKAIKSLFRMMTPMLVKRHVPMITINHTIASMDKYKIDEMSGGRGPMYSSHNVIYMGKSQIKGEGKDSVSGKAGHQFKMKLVKSRFAKEHAVIPIDVLYGSPEPHKYTGLYELALDTGDIFSPSSGWRAYQTIDKETGELTPKDECPKFREKELKDDLDGFWPKIFETTNFEKNVENMLSL